MNSGKSIEILKVAYNYEEQGKPVVLLTSRLDNRDGVGYISSRIGMKRKAYPIGDDTDIFGYIANMDPRPYCVLVDEAQFLTRANVYDLARIVDELDIPAVSYTHLDVYKRQHFNQPLSYIAKAAISAK